MLILKRCWAKRIYIFDVCMFPTPACVSLLLVGREEDLQWNVAPSLQLQSGSPPVQTCIRLTPWGSQEGAEATEEAQERGSESSSASSIHLICNQLAQGAPVPAG